MVVVAPREELNSFSHQGNDMHVRLLSTQDDDDDDDCSTTTASANDDDEHDATKEEEDETTVGLLKLLRFLHHHTFMLFISCVVLIIRLPFSLIIPHLVTKTIYAVTISNTNNANADNANDDVHSAYKFILLLFICGSIDSVLDFFTVYLFGITQQLVRQLMIITLKHQHQYQY